MAEKKQKLVKVPDVGIVAFPSDMEDEHVAAAIRAFKQQTPDQNKHTHATSPHATGKVTEESEHQRLIGGVPEVIPNWNTVRPAVYKATEPTLPNPDTKPADSSWGANRDAAWNAGANTLNVGGNVLKRAARFTFGVADMPTQVYGIMSRLFSSDEKTSQQAEGELLDLHPGAQIADRMKEAVHDWRKSKSLAAENALGDILGVFLLEKSGKYVPRIPGEPEPAAGRWMGDAKDTVVTSGNVGKYKTYAVSAPNGAILGKLNLEDLGNGRTAVRGTSVRVERHGYGSKLLEEAIKSENAAGRTVVLEPEETLYPQGKALWESLARRGLAKKVGNGYEAGPNRIPGIEDVKKEAAKRRANGGTVKARSKHV